jgi:hypothetical protein
LKVQFVLSPTDNTLQITELSRNSSGFHKETMDDMQQRFPEAFEVVDGDVKKIKGQQVCHVWCAKIEAAAAHTFEGMTLHDGMKRLIEEGKFIITNRTVRRDFLAMAQ